MFKSNVILIGMVAVLSIMLWGCAGNLPDTQRTEALDMNWGKSYESAKNNQILNPEAGKNLDPVVGLDGEAAGHSMKKYKESFKKEIPAPTTTILKLEGT